MQRPPHPLDTRGPGYSSFKLSLILHLKLKPHEWKRIKRLLSTTRSLLYSRFWSISIPQPITLLPGMLVYLLAAMVVVPPLNEDVNMAPKESTEGQEEDEIMVEATPPRRKKMKAKEITPMVDDEDRRSYRFKKTMLRSILWTQALKNDQWSKTRRNGGLGQTGGGYILSYFVVYLVFYALIVVFNIVKLCKWWLHNHMLPLCYSMSSQ